jgi:hypothetical protein
LYRAPPCIFKINPISLALGKVFQFDGGGCVMFPAIQVRESASPSAS